MQELIVFRALADRTRLSLVRILLKGERCACELPRMVRRAQPTVSLQLRKLVRAGVLSFHREGNNVIYRVANPKIVKLLRIFQ